MNPLRPTKATNATIRSEALVLAGMGSRRQHEVRGGQRERREDHDSEAMDRLARFAEIRFEHGCHHADRRQLAEGHQVRADGGHSEVERESGQDHQPGSLEHQQQQRQEGQRDQPRSRSVSTGSLL